MTADSRPRRVRWWIALPAVLVLVGLGVMVSGPFQQLMRMSDEGTTKGNLGAIRSAISIYYGDNEGLYPATLSTAPDSPFSRYLDVLPAVITTHRGLPGGGKSVSPAGHEVLITANETITVTGRGWRYNPKTGHVFVNSCATDTMGVSYSTYGY